MTPPLLFENQTPEGQWVLSFEKSHSLMGHLRDILLEAGKEQGPLQRNYQDRFDHEGHLLYSLVLDNDKPIMFSTLYGREFYGPTVARCLTRMWKNQAFRFQKPTKRFSSRLHFMLKHQTDFVRKHRPDINFLFISHQERHPLLMRYWAHHASSTTGLSWHSGRGRYLIAPNPTAPDCWQWISYVSLNRHMEIPFKLLTEGPEETLA